MREIPEEAKGRFFDEVGIQLRKAGFETGLDKEGLLAVDFGGMRLCRVNGAGGVQYRQSDVEACDGGDDALHKVIKTAAVTSEYMSVMEAVPFLKADELDDKWKLLTEYGNTVFAGAQTSVGVTFATWDRTFDRSGVTIGHYFDDYTRAKRDFAVRAGLFPKAEVFTNEQLGDIYRCLKSAQDFDNGVTYDDYKRFEEIKDQIERVLPSIAEQNQIQEQTM